MTGTATSIDQMVTALVPLLSRSLAQQFNTFRVMHHGTHEKQLSNVFSWLLAVDATHALGNAFQSLFIERVNGQLPTDSRVPTDGYRVIQEVDTSGHDALGMDIADIVLTSADAQVVIENFESSDGHGHHYQSYLAFGATGGRQSVVVLLCARREVHRQTDGWEQAIVVTYADVLHDLRRYISANPTWQRRNPRQHFFINELIEHFTEGMGAVGNEDRIAFIKAMCDTGESARYGHRPQERAAQSFADLVALHAKRQFEEGRTTLTEVKWALKRYSERTLMPQANSVLPIGPVASTRTRFVGQWEWCVELERAHSQPNIAIGFGPTAVVVNALVAEPISNPDYTRVFVTRAGPDGFDRILQTEVALDEVLAGLDDDDFRLRDSVLTMATMD